MGASHTRVYRNGVLEAEDFAVAQVSEYLDDPETVLWVDPVHQDPAATK